MNGHWIHLLIFLLYEVVKSPQGKLTAPAAILSPVLLVSMVSMVFLLRLAAIESPMHLLSMVFLLHPVVIESPSQMICIGVLFCAVCFQVEAWISRVCYHSMAGGEQQLYSVIRFFAGPDLLSSSFLLLLSVLSASLSTSTSDSVVCGCGGFGGLPSFFGDFC